MSAGDNGNERPVAGREAPASARRGKASIVQFLKFNLIGLLNTAIDYAVFAMLQAFSLHAALAQALSYAAGVVNSYLFNKYWTFADRSARHGVQAVRFAALNAVTLLISVGGIYVLSDRLGMPPLVAKLPILVLTVAINYAGSRFWVFRGSN